MDAVWINKEKQTNSGKYRSIG